MGLFADLILMQGQVLPVISTLGPFGLQPWSAPSASTAAANSARLMPVRIPATVTVRKLRYYTGDTGANVDIGIYDRALNRIVSSGSLPVSASGLYTLPTPATLTPGRYYLAVVYNSATLQIWQANFSPLMPFLSASNSFPLPATITAVNSNNIGFLADMILESYYN